MINNDLQSKQAFINASLAEVYKADTAFNETLAEAMNYSLLAGGKRLRPILLMATVDTLGKKGELYCDAALALELIHTYSLIHDDLPAMDNDDYRRGRLTNHKVYGAGMAILAGDSLLTMAFSLLSDSKEIPESKKVALISELAQAAGAEGMVGGQALDLQSENKRIDFATLKKLHAAKTGCLFKAAVRMGAILGDASEKEMQALTDYAVGFGLAFQITDDILDVVGDESKIGKPQGSDIRNHKSTYVSLLSLEEAQRLADEAIGQAQSALDMFGEKAALLRHIIGMLSKREK